MKAFKIPDEMIDSGEFRDDELVVTRLLWKSKQIQSDELVGEL